MKAKSEELIELIEEVDEHITTIAYVGAAQKIQNKRSHQSKSATGIHRIGLHSEQTRNRSKLRTGANSKQEYTQNRSKLRTGTH
jgi:hypothetical protein